MEATPGFSLHFLCWPCSSVWGTGLGLTCSPASPLAGQILGLQLLHPWHESPLAATPPSQGTAQPSGNAVGSLPTPWHPGLDPAACVQQPRASQALFHPSPAPVPCQGIPCASRSPGAGGTAGRDPSLPRSEEQERAGGWPRARSVRVPASSLLCRICSQSKPHSSPKEGFSPPANERYCFPNVFTSSGAAARPLPVPALLRHVRREPRARPCSTPSCRERSWIHPQGTALGWRGEYGAGTPRRRR